MTHGNRPRPFVPSAPALALAFLAGCGGGGAGSSTNTISVALQDLTADPEGTTTEITFASTRGLAAAFPASFAANGGQTALTVSVAGTHATVTWDSRVAPGDQVRAVGLAGVSTA